MPRVKYEEGLIVDYTPGEYERLKAFRKEADYRRHGPPIHGRAIGTVEGDALLKRDLDEITLMVKEEAIKELVAEVWEDTKREHHG